MGSLELLAPQSWPVVDGLISYVITVIQSHFPAVQWVLDTDPHPRYIHQNKPTLELGRWLQPVPDDVGTLCRNIPVKTWPDDALAQQMQSWFQAMREAQAESSAPPPSAPDDDELVDVVDLRVEDGGRHRPRDPDFEIGLDEWLAGTHPKLLTTLRKALSKEPGVVKVVEEDREVLLVHAPD